MKFQAKDKTQQTTIDLEIFLDTGIYFLEITIENKTYIEENREIIGLFFKNVVYGNRIPCCCGP